MSAKQLQRGFIKQVCRGKKIVVAGESALVHGYDKPCKTKVLVLTCHEDYDIETQARKFATDHNLVYGVTKDTPASLQMYFSKELMVNIRYRIGYRIDFFATFERSGIVYQNIDAVLSSLLSSYSLMGLDSSNKSIEWILKNRKNQLGDSTLDTVHLFAEHKGWDSIKELLN